ncbi:hypothetical protein RB653_008298 [Dictyostelium firmibasis]|uniref:Ankyrin repeat-containing protein n=1 Tax=Dictyostelium firmibasis TaxID=79012 RepID=A0AAN7YR18_9MYCE
MEIKDGEKQQRGEHLFFKVFRNKVIRTIIFKFIEGTGTKYSSIHSALWMMNNKHYELFKDKLKTNSSIEYPIESYIKVIEMIDDIAILNLFIDDFNRASLIAPRLIPIIDYLATYGKLEFIKHLENNYKDNKKILYSDKPIDCSCLSGSIECLKYLEENYKQCTTKALDNASMKGHLEIVKYLLDNRTEGGENALSLAIENGHLEVVKYLDVHAKSLKTSDQSWNKAAENGHLEMCEYLHKNRKEGFTVFAVDKAAAKGHLEVVKYLIKNRLEGCTPTALNLAAKYNHAEICKFLIESKAPGNSNSICNAALTGNIHLVNFIHSKTTYRVSANTFSYVCLNGDFEMVKCLTLLDTPMTYSAYEKAAQNGHFKIIEFLHFNRPNDFSSPQAANLAAQFNHYNTLRFLIKYRPESNPHTALKAASDNKNEKIPNLQKMNDIDYNKDLFNLEELLRKTKKDDEDEDDNDFDEEINNINICNEIKRLFSKKQGTKLIYVLEEMDYNDEDEPFNSLIGVDKLIGDKLIKASKQLDLSLYMSTLVIKENRFIEDPTGIDFQQDLKEWDNYDFDSFLINFFDLNNCLWEDMIMNTLEFDEVLPGGSLSEIENHLYKKKLPFHYQSQITQQLFYKVSTFVFFKSSEKSNIIENYCSKNSVKERELNKLKQNS